TPVRPLSTSPSHPPPSSTLFPYTTLFRSPLLATWPLLLGMGILMLGAGLQGTILGLRATLEGFPTPVTGLVMSCYYVGYLLGTRSEEHTSELQSRSDLVCRLLLEKKKDMP